MTEEVKYEPYIETYTGKKFYFLDPDPDSIDIVDIAHSLAMQCRFNGHTDQFYSVAEHSVIVSLLVPEESALEGLLHDASEAYLSDLAGPIKPHLEGYKDLEYRAMVAIGKKFGFDWPIGVSVKHADMVQLKTEAKYLLATGGKDWVDALVTGSSVGKVPRCLSPWEAKIMFMKRYEEIEGSPQLILPLH